MQSKIDQVKAKVAQCIMNAERQLGIKMPNVEIRFDLKGRAAGIAGWVLNTHTGVKMYYLRFNVLHMQSKTDWDHIIDDTVPHEVAHTVCQAFPRFGKNHNNGWKMICVLLGGTGKRCYSADDAPEAVIRNRPIVYVASNGKQIPVSKIVHGKIQRGQQYRMKDGGFINVHSEYYING